MNIYCIQETRFNASDSEGVLSYRFCLFSAYFDSRSRVIYWLISHSLGPASRLCVLDVTIKDNAFLLRGIPAPKDHAEREPFFWRIDRFVIPSKRVVLLRDWSAVLDPDLDRRGARKGTSILFDVKKKFSQICCQA